MTPPRIALPIDPALPEVLAQIAASPSLVIEAPPGAGKTTRVPWALLSAGVAGRGPDGPREVVVLEPRRLAARMAARRVAEEIGEAVGEQVGYAVRFEEAGGPRTRLRFVTQGILLRRFLGDALAGRTPLAGVGVVVLDEFHERTLEGDLALALLLREQQSGRSELKLVAMSATLDAEPLARFLGAGRVRSEGRRFEVGLEFAATRDERPLEDQVAAAVRRLCDAGEGGDVLVFLPGAREIRRAGEKLAALAARAQLAVMPLYGDQSPAEQDRAVRPSPDGRRKVILATNVAETSITIDGVTAVVDSGLARIASHDPWSGLPTLKVARISRASAAQRAGRAGRTRPGRALRLYTRHDHDTRPEFDTPAVRREDLADTLLLLAAIDGAQAASGQAPPPLRWFEEPPAAALSAAAELLGRLGALDAHGRLTQVGDRLARMPLHPRLGRLLLEAERRGVGREGALLAAVLGEGRRGARPRTDAARLVSGPSDLLVAMEERPLPDAVSRSRRALSSLLRPGAAAPRDPEAALLQAVLAGFPDRVARRRRAGEPGLLLAGGGTATLSPDSVVKGEEWMVVVDAEERIEGGPPRRDAAVAGPLASMASAIEPDWLLDLPEALREEDELLWNERAGRVEAVRRLRYQQLIVDESPLPSPDPAKVAAVLLAHAQSLGARVATADEPEALDQLLCRLSLLSAARPDVLPAVPGEAEVAAALGALCVGRRSLDELHGASLCAQVREGLPAAARDLIDRLVPERVSLPGGRSLRITYLAGQPPFVASRLQDFFGLAEGPGVAGAPLTLHLLAPNQRAVQVTSDLSGFWQRHYPAIRRELMRRYPRHAWPEDPLHAEPPRGGRPR